MGNIFGGGNKSVDTEQAAATIDDAKKASDKNRSALFMTPGGSMGQELNPDQTKKRDTLFGN